MALLVVLALKASSPGVTAAIWMKFRGLLFLFTFLYIYTYTSEEKANSQQMLVDS